jgi:hypothetical protein
LLLQRDTLHRLDRSAKRGELRRIVPGVYAPADEWQKLTPWHRYLCRVHAVARSRPRAVFCLESAAVLLGLPVFGEPAEVHVLTSHGTSRSAGGVREHRSGDHRSLLTLDGLRVTSPVDTVVDLARSRHTAVGITSIDAFLRLDEPGSIDALHETNAGRLSRRGARFADLAISQGTALAETPIESVSRCVISWLGYPAPELQREFRGSNGELYRVDAFWPDEDVIGEADGRQKYDGSIDLPARTVYQEKLREDDLRRFVEGFARWGWYETIQYRKLDGILRVAGLRPLRPERTGPLLTLADAVNMPRMRSNAARLHEPLTSSPGDAS